MNWTAFMCALNLTFVICCFYELFDRKDDACFFTKIVLLTNSLAAFYVILCKFL